MKMLIHPLVPPLLAVAALAACGGGSTVATNTKPDFLGAVRATVYDGAADDLLTAGLGATGLAAAAPPAYRWHPPPPSCAVWPSTPTTAPCST